MSMKFDASLSTLSWPKISKYKSSRFYRQTQLLELQSVTKWVETFALNWAFLRFTDFKRGNLALPPPPPPCNVVLLLELPIENNKHPNFEWRGQGIDIISWISQNSAKFGQQKLLIINYACDFFVFEGYYMGVRRY